MITVDKRNSETSARERRASAVALHRLVSAALIAVRTNLAAAAAVADALVEASLRGVDSHGVRLLVHYCKAAEGGRIKDGAALAFSRTGPCTGVVDGGDGFGHPASFAAADHAAALARESGIGAVSVINSSHFGAAGCYALRMAEAGLVGFVTCNSDSFVLPHNGVAPFHGTNPLAFAAPVAGEQPFLVDMATSAIPWNRVQDLMMKGLEMPEDVSVDAAGNPTREPARSAALLPLGGMRFGFKGAALAAMAEVMSAVMTGMPHCSRLLPMAGPDFGEPRHLGHFLIAIDPLRFVTQETYEQGMRAYLDDLRRQPPRDPSGVLAPGDREWAVERERRAKGIPISPALAEAFDTLADRLAIERLVYEVLNHD